MSKHHLRNFAAPSSKESAKRILEEIDEKNRNKKLLQGKLQKMAVRYESSFGPDLDAIEAFKKGTDYQGYVGRGKNRKLKFEVKGNKLYLHGHNIATKTKDGIEVSNAGFDTGLTYSTLKELGINAKRTPGGKVILHKQEIDAASGQPVFVPTNEISSSPIRATKPQKKQKHNRTVTEQSTFRKQVEDRERREQGRNERELPLASTVIQPKDQRVINKITGVKSKIPKETRATSAHHIFPVEKYPELKSNPSQGIMLTRAEHKELHELNPTESMKALRRRVGKLKIAERLRAFTNTSSFVGNMRYDQDEQSMTGILSGKHYKWCNVPEKTFDAFQGAGSAGAFFNRQVKGQFDCNSGGRLNEIQSRISKLRTAGIFDPDPADPNYAIDTADYDTQRKMADIEYPLVRKFKNYRENKFAPTTKEINGGTYDVIKDQMPNIPASRVTGTSPTGESELDMKIRKDPDMLDFVPGQKSEEEIDRELKVINRGPFDEKYLHPERDDVDVDTEVEWNLDEYAEGADFEERTHTTVNDKTMQSIYSLLEKAETEYDPRAREQAKIKLMQYMPLGDNNPDDILDYILENGIDSLSSPNIFGVSLKNADRYAKLRRKVGKIQRIAGIKPMVRKKKKGKAIKKIAPKVGMIQTARKTIIDDINVEFLKHPLRTHQKGGFTYNPIDSEFLDASDRNQALKIRDVFKADKNKPFGIAAITDTKKGTTPITDPVQILGETKYLEQKGQIPIWGGYKGSYEVGFGIKGTHEDILKQTPKTQESALVIDPDGTSYLLYKEDGKKEKITIDKGNIQTAKMMSADAIINSYNKIKPDIKGKSGVYDPVENRILDARIPMDAIRLQNFFESGQNSIGFNSVTDTRQGPMEDIETVRSQLKQIEQTGGVPALGFDEGSLEALDVKIGSENDIMTNLLENQRSTGILDYNLQFKIEDNPKFRKN